MMTKFASFGCLAATAAALLMTSSAGMAEQGEVDPGQVSEGLKAIFSYGRGNHTTQDHLNANTTTVITGTIGGTYVQIGADLASMLDDGEKLRILPIVGRGSVQSLADILYLKGVDLGIVRSDTLDYLEKKGFATNIKGQLSYITKLYNEEMHVVAAKTIQKMSDLEGKTVSVDLPNGGTFITAITVFDRLGIKPNLSTSNSVSPMRNCARAKSTPWSPSRACLRNSRPRSRMNDSTSSRSNTRLPCRRTTCRRNSRRRIIPHWSPQGSASIRSRCRRSSLPITGLRGTSDTRKSNVLCRPFSTSLRISRSRRSIRNGKRCRSQHLCRDGNGFPPRRHGSTNMQI